MTIFNHGSTQGAKEKKNRTGRWMGWLAWNASRYRQWRWIMKWHEKVKTYDQVVREGKRPTGGRPWLEAQVRSPNMSASAVGTTPKYMLRLPTDRAQAPRHAQPALHTARSRRPVPNWVLLLSELPYPIWSQRSRLQQTVPRHLTDPTSTKSNL